MQMCAIWTILTTARFTDEDFYDADHLNVHGAEKFTRILDREVTDGD